jgi:hypothetical protein
VPKGLIANLFFREMLLERCGTDPEFRAFIYWVCERDYMFAIDAFVFQINPTAENNVKIAPWINRDYQDEFFSTEINRLDTRVEKGDVAVRKSRKMGATWMVLILYYLFWNFARKQERYSFGLTSKTKDDVDSSGNPNTLFAKIRFIKEHVPRWFKPSEIIDNQLSITSVDSDSKFVGDATTGDMFRSGRVDSLFDDEMAFIKASAAREAWGATAAVTDIRYVVSTEHGRGQFFQICQDVSTCYEFHWTICKEYTKGMYKSISYDGGHTFVLQIVDTSFSGWVEQRRRGKPGVWKRFPEDYEFILDGRTRSPWYDKEASRLPDERMVAQELDMSPGGSEFLFFDYDSIQRLIAETARPPLIGGELVIDEYGEVNINTENVHDKILDFWFDAFLYNTDSHDGEKVRLTVDRQWLCASNFVVASDIALGSGAANSVSVVYNMDTKEKVCRLRSANISPEVFAKMNAFLCRQFNKALHVYDATGFIGDRTYRDAFKKTGYSRIYYRENGNPGFNMNPSARSDLLLKYRDYLFQNMIINRSEDGLKECLEFVEEEGAIITHRKSLSSVDPTGARSAHADEVMADAMAAFVMDMAYHPATSKSVFKAPKGSLAWELEQIDKEASLNDRVRKLLGAR